MQDDSHLKSTISNGLISVWLLKGTSLDNYPAYETKLSNSKGLPSMVNDYVDFVSVGVN